MSEATSRAEMERRLIERSLRDDAFRQRLLDDPKEAMEQEVVVRPVRRFSERLPGT
jgi:hypothetical protein